MPYFGCVIVPFSGDVDVSAVHVASFTAHPADNLLQESMVFILGRLASTRLYIFIGNEGIIQHFAPSCRLNPFKPDFTIVIFIHYKPRIAVAILDL